MSTSPYDLDLREKVIEYITGGYSQVSAAKIFSLNVSTVNRWYLRYVREGHFLPRQRIGAKSKINQDEFVKYVDSNPNLTRKEISIKFDISDTAVGYWLKKLNFSFKKKPLPTWKRSKKNVINT